ncbi:MAG: AmmeMemoRadiSam system radical SAM enzyme, partial [Candidatus Omnitrophica bacterium]|nr:AmmeMemoRadiSam system radical SAM enzyme [Candidatus Omnitrophota bacterium]
DPIEKKPFYHFLPGSKSFSIATAGCNSRCKFCQNWTISQSSPEEVASRRLTCDQVVEGAIGNGCSAIAYTYSEPTVFYEYMLDTAKRARKRGVRNIVVTGGKISPDPLKELCGSVEAVNIDLKGMDPTYLSDVCAQDLDDILKTILIYKREGVWVELTNLIVPTMNDNMEDIKRMASWVVENAGPDVPMHFSRFWPQYKLRSLYPTPVETLLEAREVAIKAGLHYVYVGNVPGSGSESTSCPSCSKTVIKRIGYRVTENNVRPDGTCSFCSGRIAGVWV